MIGVQGDAAEIVERRHRSAGCRATRAHFSPTPRRPPNFSPRWLQPGDLLLVKGSRGVKMERIVEALRARYALAGDAAAGAGAPQGRALRCFTTSSTTCRRAPLTF